MSVSQDLTSTEYTWTTYQSESTQFQEIVDLIQNSLSEPYSMYTLRYFLYSWPWLCHIVTLPPDLAQGKGAIVGVILGRVEFKASKHGSYDEYDRSRARGYIAMLVVRSTHRRHGLGRQLIERFIDSVRSSKISKIYLETEVCNTTSLHLYERLGFVRVEFLPKYYWNGNGAYRLKLYDI